MLAMPQMNLNDKWNYVEARNAKGDGQFFYAVMTTGIYCRPSCSSRQPRRENVEYFDIPEAAEQAGYRACKRCKPDAAELAYPAVAPVRKACRFIDQALEMGAEERPTLDRIAAHIGLSPHHFQRKFKKVMGISPADYAEARRLASLKHGLKQNGDVTRAIYDAGYGAASRVYEKADQELGMSPKKFAKGAAGLEVRYAMTDSPLGRLFVAATDKGVSFLSLGDDEDHLLAECRHDLPNADLRRDDTVLKPWLDAVVAYLEGRIPHPDQPLDVRGTAFQRRVWRELMKIPAGVTKTYSEVASEMLDNPNARRAIARACATNPVSLIIPCHRVKRGDGGLGGYRWGLERKQALIELEAATGND